MSSSTPHAGSRLSGSGATGSTNHHDLHGRHLPQLKTLKEKTNPDPPGK